MIDRDDIEKRYEQFLHMNLPGQPEAIPMSIYPLVSNLHGALIDAEAERDRLRDAFETVQEFVHRRYGIGPNPIIILNDIEKLVSEALKGENDE